jgi:carbon storage regulator
MLFLTRKIGQSIRINDDIEIRVVEVSGKTVKLGLQFPKHIQVLREELYEKIQAENKAAASTALEVKEELAKLYSPENKK